MRRKGVGTSLCAAALVLASAPACSAGNPGAAPDGGDGGSGADAGDVDSADRATSGAPACNPRSDGGIPLRYIGGVPGYQDEVGQGGWTYGLSDFGGSTICVAPTRLCAMGKTVADTGPNYGAQLGLLVSYSLDSGKDGPFAVPLTSTGLNYSLSSVPPGGRLAVVNGPPSDIYSSDTYCVFLLKPSGTIKWTMFNTKKGTIDEKQKCEKRVGRGGTLGRYGDDRVRSARVRLFDGGDDEPQGRRGQDAHRLRPSC